MVNEMEEMVRTETKIQILDEGHSHICHTTLCSWPMCPNEPPDKFRHAPYINTNSLNEDIKNALPGQYALSSFECTNEPSGLQYVTPIKVALKLC